MNLPKLGAAGYVLDSLGPDGFVVVDGVTYPARTRGEELGFDQSAVVIGHDEGRLVVRAANDAETTYAAKSKPPADVRISTHRTAPQDALDSLPDWPESTAKRRCPDCGGALQAIKLFARSAGGGVHGYMDVPVLRYAAAEAQRGSWSYLYEVAGKVNARLCSSCHRIFLYGEPGVTE